MPFTLRNADLPADYARIAELLNTAVTPPVTADDLDREDRELPAGSIMEQIIAMDDRGGAVGYAKVQRFPNTKAGKVYIYVVTDPAMRGQGAGGALLAEVERIAAAHGANYLLGDVRDDDPASLAFMEQRGYKTQRHGFYSRLDLATWDGTPFTGVIERVAAGGIRLFSLDTDPSPASERQLYAMLSRSLPDIPGYEAEAFMSFETYQNRFINVPGKERVIVAADGDDFVGVTMFERMADGSYYTAHTSVLRAYRGRQIALALKLAAIAKARSAGARELTTGNDSLNAPMLAINRRLGFRPSAGSYDVAKHLCHGGPGRPVTDRGTGT